MTADSPASLLRRAASGLRELGAAATPGPWWGQGVWWEHWTDAEGRECHTPQPLVGFGDLGTDLIARVVSSDEDRNYIAAMSPPVALALADMFDVIADDCGSSTLTFHAALTLARTFLGESGPALGTAEEGL